MRDRVRKAKNFDGLSFVFESGEFNGIMTALDYVAEINRKEYPDYSTGLERTKETILKFSYFNINEKSVHTRLGYDELQDVMEALCMYSSIMGNDSETTFDSMIAKDTTKIWKTE